MEVPTGNYLKMTDVQRVRALLELGWSYRRIERETGIRRETVARHDPRHESKPARAAPGSAAEPHRKEIEKTLAKGLTAQRIWQDLREEYGFSGSYSPSLGGRFSLADDRSESDKVIVVESVVCHPRQARAPAQKRAFGVSSRQGYHP